MFFKGKGKLHTGKLSRDLNTIFALSQICWGEISFDVTRLRIIITINPVYLGGRGFKKNAGKNLVRKLCPKTGRFPDKIDGAKFG